jgi:hypothetical protein
MPMVLLPALPELLLPRGVEIALWFRTEISTIQYFQLGSTTCPKKSSFIRRTSKP